MLSASNLLAIATVLSASTSINAFPGQAPIDAPTRKALDIPSIGLGLWNSRDEEVRIRLLLEEKGL
jgi:hypothetical protein